MSFRVAWGIAAAVALTACGGPGADAGDASSEVAAAEAAPDHVNTLLDLWEAGTPAFGVFVPNERPRPEGSPRPGTARVPRQPPLYTAEGGRRLAENPLYDYVFLNLEGGYDGAAVAAIAEGLRSPTATGRKALLVRVPPISTDGADTARARVREVLALGADGVVIPHVRGVEEARQAIGLFKSEGADVWSPSNRRGDVVAMLMIEDPGALAQAEEIAALGGYSVLACGIGSLTRALGGDREAAEAGNQEVLAVARAAGLADMITAGTDDVEQRIREGFLALLMQGPAADDAIRLGRRAAGRD